MPTTSSVDRVLSQLELFGTKLGLETTRSVLAAVGDPHQRFSSVLVAGTNGKGSVASLLASIGTAAGYRTGLFTSPHLDRVEERIAVDGAPCSAAEFAQLLARVRPVVAEMDAQLDRLCQGRRAQQDGGNQGELGEPQTGQ